MGRGKLGGTSFRRDCEVAESLLVAEGSGWRTVFIKGTELISGSEEPVTLGWHPFSAAFEPWLGTASLCLG